VVSALADSLPTKVGATIFIMIVTTEAIILRSRKQGDTSKIVSLYTLDFGLVDVIAKGAREMKSKFGSALEPFTISKATFYKKEGKELYLLSNAEVITPMRNMQCDLEHIEAATKVIELLLRAQHHEESHPELFRLVKETLQVMNESKSVASVLFAYYLKYISFAGFAMKLDSEDENPNYFDIEKGEVVRINSSTDAQSERLQKLTPEALASLKHIERSDIKNSANLRLSPNAIYALGNLFRSYFSVHIEGMQNYKNKSGKVFSAMGK
jgi:DNA repair protein RecO (recombination protein O)